jgi:hypothetical protein
MPSLLSGRTLRRGGSGEYLDLKGAQPQLPPTPTTSTGYTLVTNDLLQTSYRSSLGNIEMNLGQLYSNLPNQNIVLYGTDSSYVAVAGGVITTSTNTGALVVEGSIGVWGTIHTGEDINVNGLTIGKGFEGINNIIIRGEAEPQVDDFDNGQETIVIGYDALKDGLITSYKNIAIGRYALHSGTSISKTIAIGDKALERIGLYHTIPYATITNITLADPVVIEAPGHDFNSGTKITVFGVEGTVELNTNEYYVWRLSTTTFALYTDINLNFSVDGTGFTPYVSSGTVELNTVYDSNIAIGIDAAKNLINGSENFFMGDEVAKNLITGSNNIYIGHDIGANMKEGSGNISLGGDNLIDGRDNQVNIGSVFYFDGQGYTQITSDLGLGLGTEAIAFQRFDTVVTATQTNPVVITLTDLGLTTGTRIKVVEVDGMVELNQQLYYASYAGTNTNNEHLAELYYDGNFTQPVDGTVFTAYTGSGTVYTLSPVGALSNLGGVGIEGNLIVSEQVDVYGGMTVKYLITGTITTATNLAGGALGSIPYQLSDGITTFIDIGASDTVLTSDGTTASWQTLGSITVGGAIDADNVFINSTVTNITYYPALTEFIGTYTPLLSDLFFTYITTTATTSTYFVTGTNSFNVPGSIYSMEGNNYENNLLYTPRVTVSASAPANPRIGDFWIDTVNGVELQWIDDGGNRFWIQFTGL